MSQGMEVKQNKMANHHRYCAKTYYDYITAPPIGGSWTCVCKLLRDYDAFVREQEAP